MPSTAAELESSPDFKLDHTTKGGIKFYVRAVSAETAESVAEDSPDYEYLDGIVERYFLAITYKGSVVSLDSLDEIMNRPDEVFTDEEVADVFSYAFKNAVRDSAAQWEKLRREAGE